MFLTAEPFPQPKFWGFTVQSVTVLNKKHQLGGTLRRLTFSVVTVSWVLVSVILLSLWSFLGPLDSLSQCRLSRTASWVCVSFSLVLLVSSVELA